MSRRLLSEDGQGLVEYALITGLVALAVLVSLAKIADPSRFPITKVADLLTNVNRKVN